MIDQYPSANGVLTSLIWRKTMSGGETSLSGYDNASQALSYTPGQEQVYLNGILLVRGDDYTATNGTSITGLSALAASDFIQVNCYNNFSVATTPATSITGTIANNQLANSAITINGSAISLGGSVTLPGDIESVTASSPLTGGGTSGAVTIGIQSASTTQSGAVQLSDSTSTTSSILAATPTAVKSAYDLAAAAIPNTLTTTTGDIIYASGANTPARRAIGSTGQVLTVAGGVPTWASPSSPSYVGAIAYGAVNQTWSNTATAVSNLTTEIVDTDNFHSTSSNTSRMTIPSGKDGKYLMQMDINLAATGGSSPNMYIRAYKNGSAITEGLTNGNLATFLSALPQDAHWNVSLVVTGVAGDYFEFFVIMGGGSSTIDKARYSFTYLGA